MAWDVISILPKLSKMGNDKKCTMTWASTQRWPLWSQSRHQATQHTCLGGKGCGLYAHFQPADHMRNDEKCAVA